VDLPPPGFGTATPNPLSKDCEKSRNPFALGGHRQRTNANVVSADRGLPAHCDQNNVRNDISATSRL
jgi:hypothetical protein